MSAPASHTASGAVAGRRRAKLVQGVQSGAERIVAAPAEPPLSIADVEALGRNPSPAARVTLAAKFGRQYDSLIDGETRTLADAILHLLVKDLEKRVRQTLAETVAASANLPRGIANRLARDDIEVAQPILEQSPVLSDEDLAEIVRTHAMQYALAVAGREHLSAFLSDLLADTGDAEVVARLVGNAGAQISVQTLMRIAEDYRTDREVQDRLIRRPALPYELVDQLVGVIGERLEWELVRERRIGADDARQLMAATRERATLNIVAREHGERTLERELRHRLTIGELGPDEVLCFLRDGEISRVEAALALLADCDLGRARQLLYGVDKRGLAALCVRAGFGTPHYLALRMTLDLAEQGLKAAKKGAEREASYSDETMRYIQDQYERTQADPDQIGQWFSH
jgi:uncharacterized protein (DUF2336 family)